MKLTSPVLFLLSMLPLVAQVAPTPPIVIPPKLGSAVFLWDKLLPQPTPVGVFRAVFDAPTATYDRLEFHVTTLLPGRFSHPPHVHPQEEIILVKEGTVEASLNGQLFRAGPGSVFFYASYDPHNLTNVGDGPATYFVFNYYSAATIWAPALGVEKSAPPGKLRSGVFNWEKLALKTTPTGARWDILNSPTMTLANFEAHATILNPGAGVPTHRHSEEEIVIIREGEVEVTIKGVTHRASPGSIIFYGSNDERSHKNIGSIPAVYHVFKAVTAATPKTVD